MNNLQLQFTSGAPIGEQEKIILKKIQTKITEVLSKRESSGEVYDEGSCLSIKLSPSELFDGTQQKDENVRNLAEQLFMAECVTRYNNSEGERRRSRSFLFLCLDTNNSEGIIFTIHRSVVENIFQSSDFSDWVNEAGK